MIRLLVAAFCIASVAAAPAALADPDNLVPQCSGGQVAQVGECTAPPGEVAASLLDVVPGNFPGVNPNIPPGLTPLNFPVMFPLGLTPRNFPVLIPQGLTPANFPVA